MHREEQIDARYQDQSRVARLINRVQAALVAELDLALEPFDITAAQYVILSTLHNGRANIAAQICREISYSPGAMTRMLDRLEQKGMILKRPDFASRRNIQLELTEDGKRIFPEMLAASSAVIDQFLGSFQPDELQTLEKMLERMLGGS